MRFCSIEMDMNNRKSETRSEQKGYDIAIEVSIALDSSQTPRSLRFRFRQELNNKFTISIGDLKTEIEQAKWEATRRAISESAMILQVLELSADECTMTSSRAYSHHCRPRLYGNLGRDAHEREQASARYQQWDGYQRHWRWHHVAHYTISRYWRRDRRRRSVGKG